MKRLNNTILLTVALALWFMPSESLAFKIDINNLFKPKMHHKHKSGDKPIIDYRQMFDKTREALFSITHRSGLDDAIINNNIALYNFADLNNSYYEVHNMVNFKHQHANKKFDINQLPGRDNILTTSLMVMEHQFSPQMSGKTLAGFSSNNEENSVPMIGSNISYDLGEGVKFNVQANHGLHRHDHNNASTLVKGGFTIQLF